MGTKSPIDNKHLNFRAFHRKRVRKAKARNPSAEQQTLTVRGQRYSTAKKTQKDTHRKKMAARHIKQDREKQKRMKQIQEAKAKEMTE